MSASGQGGYMTDDLDIEALLEAPFRDRREDKDCAKDTTRSNDSNVKSSNDRRPQRGEHDRRRRSRSKSPSRDRRRSLSRSRPRDQKRAHSRTRRHSRDRLHKRSRSRSKDRCSRHSPARTLHKGFQNRRGRSPILSDAQRDRRTVFVRQLAQRARSPDLEVFFEKAGKVRAVKLVHDRISGRSKGVAYVEFHEEESVVRATDLTGQKLLGIPVIVEITETEKNRIAEEAAEAARLAKAQIAVGLVRLYVAGLHASLTDDDVRRVFEPFGDLEFVAVAKESDGRSKECAYLQFKRIGDAKMALEQMNGFMLAGKPIRVSAITDSAGGFTMAAPAPVRTSSNLDEDAPGLSMSAKTRSELMLKLVRDTSLLKNVPGLSSAALASRPSPCILLVHMYDPATETEPHWDHAIADDVREECQAFGSILHMSVQKNSEGEVYVKFDAVRAGEAAVEALNSRWFGGRQIQALFVRVEDYQAKFPNAPS